MITYKNFWPGFDGDGSLLNHLLNVSLPDTKNLQVNVSSVFTFPTIKTQFYERLKVTFGIKSYEEYRELALYRHPKIDKAANLNIWFTAENLRPPSHGYDLALSFDPTDLERSVPNIYFPFWMYNIDWGYANRLDRREYFPTPEEIMRPATISGKRDKFCCAFFNNSEPVRLAILQSLNKISYIDTYGSLFGNPVAQKADVAKDYVFMFVPENSYYPGYITEKVFEARNVGCIPIWWGSNVNNILNPKAVLDVTFMNTTDLISSVKRIYSSLQLQQEMLAEPILNQKPEIQSKIDLMKEVFRKFS